MSAHCKQIAPAMLFMAMFASLALAGTAENASPIDPPGGFKALEMDAQRLPDEQKNRLTIASAPSFNLIYPSEALAKGLSGAVVLDVVIEPDGSVSDARVLEEDPKGAGFGDAALRAVHKYRYRNTLERRVVRTLKLRFTTPGP